MDNIVIESPIFSVLSDDEYKKAIAANPTRVDDFLDLPVEFIDWSTRVTNVFNKNNYRKIKDVISNFQDLNHFRNFGAKSYHEIATKIPTYLRKYIDSDEYKAKADKIFGGLEKESRYNEGILGKICRKNFKTFSYILEDKIRFEMFLNTSIEKIDWSVRSTNIFNKCGIKRIKDFKNYGESNLLKIKNFGKGSLKEIYDKIGNFIECFKDEETNQNQFTPEFSQSVALNDLEGLAKYLLSKMPAREKKIMCGRYGLWDGKKETLFEVGKHFKITRERIRQIQAKQITKFKKNYSNNRNIKLFFQELFNSKLKPYLENNFNIANQAELLQIIYAIDGEKISVDLANEFLSEILFDGEQIFRSYVIKFDEEIVGLDKNDRKFYLLLVKKTLQRLKEKQIPQSIDELMQHFKDIKLINNIEVEIGRIKRFLLVSGVDKDSAGNFGLEKWEYFNSCTIPGMAERALMEINQPAHFTQIVLLMNEMFPSYGSFDVHNVHARIGSRKDVFTWVSPGVYGLKKWGLERPPYVKEYIIEILKKTNRPLHLDQLTEKVLEKCNCKESSVGWTVGDDPDTFTCFGNKLYGLSKWK